MQSTSNWWTLVFTHAFEVLPLLVSHLLKKPLMENSIFCAVFIGLLIKWFIITTTILRKIMEHICSHVVLIKWKIRLIIEAVIQRCSVKKVFLETSQNSQENTCARVSFSIKLQFLTWSCKITKPKALPTLWVRAPQGKLPSCHVWWS